MKLRIKDKEYEFYLLDNEISRFLPIKGKLIRWGDEIYILVDFDIDVRDDGKIFEVGIKELRYFLEILLVLISQKRMMLALVN